MAENPYINKVVFGNDTLVDLTNDSVEASNLLEGETAHDRSGAPITGTAKQGHVIKDADGTSMTQRDNLQFKGATVTDDSVNNRTVVECQSGGLLPHLVITADSGETVTATKGGTTLTATETSTGIYEVDVTAYGTWTVSDGTNSNTVNVDSVKVYEVAVVSVPDGSTVTPTDDISIWLACGQRSETYTTLAEVLADSTCLSALMADSNAVDYLVRSKSFIGNEALVPTMTSNTTPSGEAIGIDVYNSYYYYYAFDGNNATFFNPNTYPNNEWVGYDFGTKKSINKAKFYSKSVKTYKIQYSDDGSTWNDATAEKTNSSWGTDTWIEESFPTIVARYWKLLGVTNDGRMVIYSLQFGFDGICQSSSAMTYIGLNNYASNTLLADSDWCAGICNSTYFESVLNVKIPVMTSDTTPSGTASSSTQNSSYAPYKAFDGNFIASGWLPASGDAFNSAYVAYEFTQSIKAKKIKYSRYDKYNSTRTASAKIQGYDADNSLWDDVTDTFVIPTNDYAENPMNSANSNKKYAKFRELIVSGSSEMLEPSNGHGYHLQIYGREDV